MTADFSDLGDRSQVSGALLYLEEKNRIQRICRGVYALPFDVREDLVIESYRKKVGRPLVFGGAICAGVLGLRGCPEKLVYLSTGSPTALQIGKTRIYVEPAEHWQIELGDNFSGIVARAIAYCGQSAFEEVLRHLLREGVPEGTWSEILDIKESLPRWMQSALAEAELIPVT